MVVSDAKIVEQRQERVHQRRVAAVDGQVLKEDSGLLAIPSAHRDNHAVGARTAAAAMFLLDRASNEMSQPSIAQGKIREGTKNEYCSRDKSYEFVSAHRRLARRFRGLPGDVKIAIIKVSTFSQGQEPVLDSVTTEPPIVHSSTTSSTISWQSEALSEMSRSVPTSMRLSRDNEVSAALSRM